MSKSALACRFSWSPRNCGFTDLLKANKYQSFFTLIFFRYSLEISAVNQYGPGVSSVVITGIVYFHFNIFFIFFFVRSGEYREVRYKNTGVSVLSHKASYTITFVFN